MRQRFPITNEPYQQTWEDEFNAEKQALENVFGNSAIEIEHIGATSIKGLASKPLIGIAVMIGSYKDADSFTPSLAKIGYEYEAPHHPGLPERHFYFKGTQFHLSVAYPDCGGYWPRQILFRDYLRAHPEAREEYATLKANLLQQDPSGQTYTEGKTEFIYRILRLAGWRAFSAYTIPDASPPPTVTDVVPREDYKLTLTFDTGEKRVWDADPYLDRKGFQMFATRETYQKVQVSEGTIKWQSGFLMDPTYLYTRSEVA